MNSRNVIPFYEGAELPPNHARHIKQRNGRLAQAIADAHGYDCDEQSSARPYHLLGLPVERPLGAQHGMQTNEDFYGALVDHLQHADKAALHSTIPEADHTPEFHSQRFAEAIQEVVLPGYSAFSREDALKAFAILFRRVGAVRLKDPRASDCDMQFTIRSEDQLRKILDIHFNPFPLETGLVLEQCVHEPRTVTGGRVILPSDTYHFMGEQVESTLTRSDGQAVKVYGGGDVTVTRGTVEYPDYPADQTILMHALPKAYDAYESLIPFCTRLSFDMVLGHDEHGNAVQGITDPTLRVGGNDPSVIAAMKHLADDDVRNVLMQTRVVYNEHQEVPFEGERFLDMDDIAIVTRLRQKVGKSIMEKYGCSQHGGAFF